MDNQGGPNAQDASKALDMANINLDRREVENQVILLMKNDGIQLQRKLICKEVNRYLDINRRHRRLTKFMRVIVWIKLWGKSIHEVIDVEIGLMALA